MRPLVTVLVMVLSLLSGCVDSGTTPAAANGAGVGPGPYAVPAINASILFSQVCAETAPSQRAARDAVEALPFRQNTATGTYYHTNLDLSIKIRSEGGKTVCSMVFGTKDDPRSTAIVLTAASAGGKAAIQVGQPTRANGRSYVTVFATSG